MPGETDHLHGDTAASLGTDRQAIIGHLLPASDPPQTVDEIAAAMPHWPRSRGQLVHHLRALKRAGIVAGPRGRYYLTVAGERVRDAIQ